MTTCNLQPSFPSPIIRPWESLVGVVDATDGFELFTCQALILDKVIEFSRIRRERRICDADILLDFHMGRVEWVTCQVPFKKSPDGILKSALGGILETEGARNARGRLGSLITTRTRFR